VVVGPRSHGRGGKMTVQRAIPKVCSVHASVPRLALLKFLARNSKSFWCRVLLLSLKKTECALLHLLCQR
jgi:hypothetical protein